MKARLLSLLGRTTLRSPARSDVLVLDRVGSREISTMILSGIPHTILAARHELFHLSPAIILRMLAHLPEIAELRRSRMARSLASAAHFVYLLSCVEHIRPKVAVTWIDNYPHMWWLARRLEGRCRFLPIQNALRYIEVRHLWPQEPGCRGVVDMPEYVCFGRFEEDLFRQHGHKIDRFHPVGAPKGGYYRYELAPRPAEPTWDLCLVSIWQPDETWYEWETPVLDTLRSMERCIAEFVESHGVSLVVALRSMLGGPWADWQRLEREHYEELFGGLVTIVPRDDDRLSTYECMDRSRVVLTLVSTAALEAFGWGKKTLFCAYPRLGPGGWAKFPVDGPWVLEDESYEAFEQRVVSLLGMSDEDWRVASQEASRYLVQYEPDGPAHRYVRGLVLETLGRQRSPFRP